MSEIKYTSDGKKVVVIGNLNSVEKIVQEIFIIDGAEIPSGEHFTVKSLHDAPAISWQEKEITRIKKEYETSRTKFEDGEREYDKKLRVLHNEFREKTRYLKSVINNISAESFDMVTDFLTGKITHVVELSYGCKIMNYKESFAEYGDNWFRLLSLDGKDDGTLTWHTHQYYDRSGYQTKIVPCRSHKEAVEVIKAYITSEIKERIHDSTYKLAMEYSIPIPEEVLAKYKAEQILCQEKYVKQSEEELNKHKELLSKAQAI